MRWDERSATYTMSPWMFGKLSFGGAERGDCAGVVIRFVVVAIEFQRVKGYRLWER